MKATEKAWAAGFIDGEGCLEIRRGTKRARYTPRIVVGNTSVAALDQLQRLFKGSISRRAPQGANHRAVYAWEVSGGRRVAFVLDAILPYLVEKQAQAKILHAYVKSMRKPGNGQPLTEAEIAVRESAVLALFTLKRVGRG